MTPNSQYETILKEFTTRGGIVAWVKTSWLTFNPPRVIRDSKNLLVTLLEDLPSKSLDGISCLIVVTLPKDEVSSDDVNVLERYSSFKTTTFPLTRHGEIFVLDPRRPKGMEVTEMTEWIENIPEVPLSLPPSFPIHSGSDSGTPLTVTKDRSITLTDYQKCLIMLKGTDLQKYEALVFLKIIPDLPSKTEGWTPGMLRDLAKMVLNTVGLDSE